MQAYKWRINALAGLVNPYNLITTPMVLFDALGFDRIVVTMRFTAAYATNGLGFFWTTM